MSNVVEIKVEQDRVTFLLGHERVRQICEPHFADGNDVRFVDADGHPILDVTREQGWVKVYDAPEPATALPSDESVPLIEAPTEGAVEEAVPAEPEAHAEAAGDDGAEGHAEEHVADAPVVDEHPASDEAPPPSSDEESPR